MQRCAQRTVCACESAAVPAGCGAPRHHPRRHHRGAGSGGRERARRASSLLPAAHAPGCSGRSDLMTLRAEAAGRPPRAALREFRHPKPPPFSRKARQGCQSRHESVQQFCPPHSGEYPSWRRPRERDPSSGVSSLGGLVMQLKEDSLCVPAARPLFRSTGTDGVAQTVLGARALPARQ